MKNMVVIVKPKTGADLSNVARDAREIEPSSSGVLEISNGVWLIDIHRSLAFLAAIVSSAKTRGLDVFAFEVADVLTVPEGFDLSSL
jgi:hypothetical protein